MPKVIDVHTHCTRIHFPTTGVSRDHTLTPEQLVNTMDREGVDIAVLLPLEAPDAYEEYYLTIEAMRRTNCMPLISSEKTATAPLSSLAAAKAKSKANAVFPIEGRAPTITRSPP